MLKLNVVILGAENSSATGVFDPAIDHKEVYAIRSSKRPVSLALRFLKRRWNVTNIAPVQGVALTGL